MNVNIFFAETVTEVCIFVVRPSTFNMSL